MSHKCLICNELNATFNTDIRDFICDECLFEMNEYLSTINAELEAELN